MNSFYKQSTEWLNQPGRVALKFRNSGSHSPERWLKIMRIIQDILIISVDNLKGFSEAIAACYPETRIQKCNIHQIRNSTRYVSYKDVKKITSALRPIYTASTEAAAQEELNQFEKVWGEKYPLIVRSWRQNWAELATFFDYPPEIRKIIYTTTSLKVSIGSYVK